MSLARSAPALLIVSVAFAADPAPTPEQADRFEKQVRPLLVEHCYSCHSASAKKVKGGLRVDGRKYLLEGGDIGPAIVPGDPAKSRIIEAVKYGNKDLLMPPEKKLPAEAVAVLEAWIKEGAPWPNDTGTEVKKEEFDLQKRKEAHWAWKPLASRDRKGADVDQFIREALTAKALKPAAPADKLTLLRRVTFALTGLPPTPAEVAACEAGTESYEQAVDRLLASPAFGERWARHWLDLARYAESRGHEFEPDIPNATVYRDYVIRAFNADVPYNQFVKEHLAGDCLPAPRISKSGTNESAIGSGFWHLGEEVHSPVDIRADQADRYDNRIDAATKTFLGLTVACARCHDHKFDAIGTKDYYALFGVLEASTYRQIRIDGWEKNREAAKGLKKVRDKTDEQLAGLAQPRADKPRVEDLAFAKTVVPVVDYSQLKPGEWLPDDATFGDAPRGWGWASVRLKADKYSVYQEPYTAAVFDPFWANLKLAPHTANDAGALGRVTRAGYSIRTPTFVLEKKRVHYLVRGGGMSFAAVGQQSVIAGPLHGSLVHPFGSDDKYRWVTQDLSGYVGQRLHVELTADPKTPFAVAMVVQADDVPPLPRARGFETPLTKPEDVATAKRVAEEAQAAEKELAKTAVWESRLAIGMWDGPAVDAAVFVRGNHRSPGAVVPHRSLEAIHGPAGLTHKTGSGRLELAEQWTDAKTNPFVPRVMANRVWHHLFGRGLVASTDNFGVLGELPTHPELLDALALDFVADGWSVKKLVRKLVLTDTYRQSSTADAEADKADPSNLLLHKFRLKRLEGEAIRDAMLSVCGRLDPKPPATNVPTHLTPFMDGRGRPGASGPLDGDGKRSIYLSVRRNFLSPFLLAFDTPIPFSPVGRRQVSNVPAQALILLNDPFVHGEAARWGQKLAEAKGTATERVAGMYRAAFGRPPTDDEAKTCAEFVKGKEADPKAWAELAHTLFNVKEFVFIR